MKRIKFEKISKRALQIKLAAMKYRQTLLIAESLDLVSAKYGTKVRVMSFSKMVALHKKRGGGKYTERLHRVYEYLEELRGVYGNPIEHFTEDYFMCIFDYYSRFNRRPTINQITPSAMNQVRFEEWITALERDIAPDKYFMTQSIDIDKMKKDAAKLAEGIMKKRTEKPTDIDDVKITII